MSDGKPKVLHDEILPDGAGRVRDAAAANEMLHLKVPTAPDVSLGQALVGQLPYWGAGRVIRAYRKAVDEGVAAVEANRLFYQGMRELEAEKVRWENIDKFREGTAYQIDAWLKEQEAARNRAVSDVSANGTV